MLFFLNIDVAVATQNIMINILTLDWIMFTIVFGAAEKNTRVKSLVVDWIVLTFDNPPRYSVKLDIIKKDCKING